MVMGYDSCLRSNGLESRHCILDGHFFTLICSKNFIVCLKRPKNKNNPGLAHFVKNYKKEKGNVILKLIASFSVSKISKKTPNKEV